MTSGNRPLYVSEKEIADVRAALSMGDEASIRRDVDMVVEWYSKQQHLPRVLLDRDIVERMLINRKGSVEQTKQKIDLMFTLRTLVPDMASPRDVFHPDIQRQFQSMMYVPLPNLNHDLTRVQVYKLTPNVDVYNMIDSVMYIFMSYEYRLKYDYTLGDRIIVDYEHGQFAHAAKLNPTAIKKAEIVLHGYGHRIFSIHFVNVTSLVSTIMNILKVALSPKLAARIMIHSKLEDLHKFISKEVLPQEYGGEKGPLEMLAEQWKEEMSRPEVRQYLKEQESLRSNEALRIEPRPTDDTLGIPGTFKTIDID